MSITRKRYTSEFKTKIVLEFLLNSSTLNELASKHGSHLLGTQVEKQASSEDPEMYCGFSKKDKYLKE